MEKSQVKSTKIRNPKNLIAQMRARLKSKPKSSDTLHKQEAPAKTKRPTLDDLINAESALGRTLFGPIPEGHQREFFHHQNNVWIWHESWFEGDEKHQITVRYEVRENGVYKRVNRGKYCRLSDYELKNFIKATHAYLKLIKQKLYRTSASMV